MAVSDDLGRRPVLRVDPWIQTQRTTGGMTTRVGFPTAGTGRDDERSRARSRELLARALGHDPDRAAWVRQVHGTEVVRAGRGGMHGEADALVSVDSSVVLLVSVADCAPVALWDPRGGAFGIAHAGWRGTVAGVVESTVAALTDLGAEPPRLRAWVGPRIGPRRFEVGPEVAERFDPNDVLPPDGDRRRRPHVDLGTAIARRLVRCGLDTGRVRLSDDCTFERDDLYWSYRRDGGLCGRQLAWIGRR